MFSIVEDLQNQAVIGAKLRIDIAPIPALNPVSRIAIFIYSLEGKRVNGPIISRQILDKKSGVIIVHDKIIASRRFDWRRSCFGDFGCSLKGSL